MKRSTESIVQPSAARTDLPGGRPDVFGIASAVWPEKHPHKQDDSVTIDARLSSDDLGTVGQDDFASLCSREALIANRSIRDRTGWDFRVEFPNTDLSSSVPLDQRPSPLAVLVQVKSVYETATKVTLKLRTFERLMKAHEPAFIVIPVYSQKNRLDGLYAIHLVGAALEKSLERLAALHAATEMIGENDTISFSRKKWWTPTTYPETGCIRSYLSTSIEAYGEPHAYIANKARELTTLGYEQESQFIGNMTLIADSEDEIIEGMLGLRQLKASHFAVSDRRFGIERLLHRMEGGEGTVTISPVEKKPCLLRIYNADGSRRGDVSAELVAPGIKPSDDNKLRFLIYVDELRLDVSFAGKLTAHMSGLDSASHPVDRWIEMLDVFEALLSPGCKIELLTPAYQRAWGAGNLDLAKTAPDAAHWCRALRRSADNVLLVFDRASLLRKPVDFETIADSERVFEKASGLLAGPDVSFTIGLNVANPESLDELFDKSHGLTLAGWIEVDGTVIAYAVAASAQLKMVENEYSLECCTTGQADVSIVADTEAYETVVEDHYCRHGSRLRIASDPPKFANAADQ